MQERELTEMEQTVQQNRRERYSWTIASSPDKDYIFELAKTHGWLEKPPRVQIRRWAGMDFEWYIIEPYEPNCNCPDVITAPIEEEE